MLHVVNKALAGYFKVLEVVWRQSRMLGNTRRHARTDFITVMKGENEVGPFWPDKCFVGTGLAFDLSADTK